MKVVCNSVIITLISGSKSPTLIDARCSNMAQHMGVANVRAMPQIKTLRGVEDHGYRLKNPLLSRAFIATGVITERVTSFVYS